MKTLRSFSILFCLPILIACGGQYKEAKEARKKSDSILDEFKKVNAGLDSSNKKVDSSNRSVSDSLEKLLKDSK